MNEATAVVAGGGMMNQLVLFAAFGIIFYFLIFRPQNKRAKQQRLLISSVQSADEVVTNAGFLGKIVRIVNEDFLILEVSTGVEILLQRQAIAQILPRGTMKASMKDGL